MNPPRTAVIEPSDLVDLLGAPVNPGLVGLQPCHPDDEIPSLIEINDIKRFDRVEMVELDGEVDEDAWLRRNTTISHLDTNALGWY